MLWERIRGLHWTQSRFQKGETHSASCGMCWKEWGWLSQRGVVPRDARGEEGLGKHSRCSGNQKGGGELKEEVEEEVMGLAGCWVLGWQREVLVHRESWFLGG